MIPVRMISVLLAATFLVVSGSNYDEFLANSLARNLALREDFLRNEPSAKSLMESLAGHQSLQDMDEFDGPTYADDEWQDVLGLINGSKSPSDNYLELEESVPRQLENQDIKLAERESVQPRSREEVFQNNLSGEHKIVGGSSEVGAWFDYALHAAGAQDEEESNKANEKGSSDVKADRLPTYCDPPNPCPIGFDPASFSAPCDEHIQNTKEFNREWNYQKMLNGECTCDMEHNKACPKNSYEPRITNSSPYMQGQKRARLVAKKSSHQINKRSSPNIISYNPYLGGMVLKRVTKKSGPKVM